MVVALAIVLLSGGVFQVRTKTGVVVLTINEPGAKVFVDDDLKITLTSASDKEPTDKPPAAPIWDTSPSKDRLLLRPNVPQTYYPYVHNPTARDYKLTVVLANGPNPGAMSTSCESGTTASSRGAVPPRCSPAVTDRRR